jgi:hypothetical protein
VTTHFGERYIWVDVLCIVQDDETDLKAQIPNMDKIYGCAYFTIAAAAERTRTPACLESDLDLAKFAEFDVEVNGTHLIPGVHAAQQSLYESVWEKRGWTHQEKVLSKRLLIFTERQIFYLCHRAVWCEDAVWENQSVDIRLKLFPGRITLQNQHCALPTVDWIGLDRYCRFVAGYHLRQLTNEDDLLHAFSGTMSALKAELNTDFLWGLPEAQLDDAFIWQSSLHNPNGRRERFPSWSWLGWRPSSAPDHYGSSLEWPCESQFHIGTYSYVDWHIVDAQVQLRRIKTRGNDPHESNVSTLLEFWPSKVPRNPGYLCFWATCARLFVRRSPADDNPRARDVVQFGIFIKGKFEFMGKIALDTDWRQTQPDCLEFVALSLREFRDVDRPDVVHPSMNLMLIDTSPVGLSQRVQLTTSHPSWWPLVGARERLVVLG